MLVIRAKADRNISCKAPHRFFTPITVWLPVWSIAHEHPFRLDLDRRGRGALRTGPAAGCRLAAGPAPHRVHGANRDHGCRGVPAYAPLTDRRPRGAAVRFCRDRGP